MSALSAVAFSPLPLDRFATVLGTDEYERFIAQAEQARRELADRTVWNVSSTAKGGGVAEMLAALLPYVRGAGVDAHWLVLAGNEPFFRLTKRLHNRLHGVLGDSGGLGAAEHEIYETTLRPAAEDLRRRVRPGDIVLLHDPQTAGLADVVLKSGAFVVWRCHIGVDAPNEIVRRAWDFLSPYLASADGYIFSKASFAWSTLDRAKVHVIPPSIDAFSPRNQALSPDACAAILVASGLAHGTAIGVPAFTRTNGEHGVVDSVARHLGAPAPPLSVPFVLQVSRWDALKDPAGVLDGFVQYVAPRSNAHLVLAGPSVTSIADDPEQAEVVSGLEAAWSALDRATRARVHIALLPMADIDENAAIVNALQRRASVVVQKSLAEGFGLTVTEAMWKARPVVASHVGGISTQIADGVDGLLVEPRDLEAYGAAVLHLLDDPADAARMGAAARERVRREFLAPPHLVRYVALIDALVVPPARAAAG